MRIHPRITQRIAVTVLSAATVLTLLILIFIIGFIFEKGLPVLSLKFLTGSPEDMGKAGGIFPTLIGSIVLPLLALLSLRLLEFVLRFIFVNTPKKQ